MVTFFPDEALNRRIDVIAMECDHVIVVDNGSPANLLSSLVSLSGRIELIAQALNLGLAAALNLGLRRAITLGYNWAVIFDQDSLPIAGMVREIWATHNRYPEAAVIGPRIEEEVPGGSVPHWIRRHPRCPCFFQRVQCHYRDLTDITLLISSGSLIDLDLWAQLRGFDEDLFIDYVDADYCLKVIRSGRNLAVSAAATLQHRLGARQTKRLLGQEMRPMYHAVFRHYFMARNRVKVWRRHAVAVPHWALFDLAFACLNGFRVVAFEPSKWRKLRAMFWGTWDGLGGRSWIRLEYRPNPLQQ